jgi:outer membrane protein assembly factor BamA
MSKLLQILILAVMMAFLVNPALAQSDSSAVDTTKVNEKIKTGWGFGGVPAVAYDTDLGFLYGLILNIYHYGDGSNYPMYNHSLYMEWSRTTKGSGKNILEYDNRTLIPKGRMKLELSYLTEQALDFYGFNGYNSYFGDEYINQLDSSYISRLYYRHDRKLLRLNADFEGKIYGKKLRWFAGMSHYNMKIGSVEIARLNEGTDAEDLLPDTASLYDKYVEWNVIPEDQKNGGITNLLKIGAIYDTRDNEASPYKGIWSEAMLIAAPSFLGNKSSFTKLSITHRQYFSLLPRKLILAYRVNYNGLIAGEIPYYMMPFYFSSGRVTDGLGGSKTLRGILRNRVVGDGSILGNLEMRYTFLRKLIFNQNFTITLSGFADAAQVVQFHPFNDAGVTASYGKTREENLAEMHYQTEGIHLSYGGGLHFAINHNFIIAIDYGMAASAYDGKSGLYIALNYLF